MSHGTFHGGPGRIVEAACCGLHIENQSPQTLFATLVNDVLKNTVST